MRDISIKQFLLKAHGLARMQGLLAFAARLAGPGALLHCIVV
jgi:hypothetical protein